MLHPQEIETSVSPELAALAAGRAHDPFASLGWHRGADGWTFRTLQPFAESVSAETARGWEPLVRVPDTPLFELRTAGAPPQHTRLRLTAGGGTRELVDPYSFPPVVGADDLWLFNGGAARQAWRVLGAHAIGIDGVPGTRFAVWAPNAERVSVVGDFNRWDGRVAPDVLARRRAACGSSSFPASARARSTSSSSAAARPASSCSRPIRTRASPRCGRARRAASPRRAGMRGATRSGSSAARRRTGCTRR